MNEKQLNKVVTQKMFNELKRLVGNKRYLNDLENIFHKSIEEGKSPFDNPQTAQSIRHLNTDLQFKK